MKWFVILSVLLLISRVSYCAADQQLSHANPFLKLFALIVRLATMVFGIFAVLTVLFGSVGNDAHGPGNDPPHALACGLADYRVNREVHRLWELPCVHCRLSVRPATARRSPSGS